ncbi:hypothetical protein NA647_09660 [Pseudomonas stutzeri]|nr:hypothetical protein [Stutzerimonas stutzeri]MCQ4287694.1 hypothetical protein [Stutzerimonas stutzeri]
MPLVPSWRNLVEGRLQERTVETGANGCTAAKPERRPLTAIDPAMRQVDISEQH